LKDRRRLTRASGSSRLASFLEERIDGGPERLPGVAFIFGQFGDRSRVADARKIRILLPVLQGFGDGLALSSIGLLQNLGPGCKLGFEPRAICC
jgi:hypothetical protein